jgi:hypothetical protein
MRAEHQLVGRDAECSAIDRLLADAAALRSGCLLLEGDVGAGKSALLGYAAASAGRLRVLRAEGVQPESDLAFAGLHQLLRPVLDRLEALPGAQSAALRGALGMGPGPADRFLVGAGVLSLLAEAAAEHGLVCLVDDVQWLDRESADALLFAARRLEAEGVAVLFAVRDEGRQLPAPGIRRIRVEGLPPADARDPAASGRRREPRSGRSRPGDRVRRRQSAGAARAARRPVAGAAGRCGAAACAPAGR